MKLKTLDIQTEYKNIKPQFIDFNASNGCAVLIGNNGSGKSNLLELLSLIFSGLYCANGINQSLNKHPKFHYTLVFEIKNTEIKVVFRTEGRTKNTVYNYQVAGKEVGNITEYLPSQVICCYSGEENRIWEDVYKEFYLSFVDSVKEGYLYQSQGLVFINKFYWNISLLSLLFANQTSPSDDISSFLNEKLGIKHITTIHFEFNNNILDSWKKGEQTNDTAIKLVELINPDKKNGIDIAIDEFAKRISPLGLYPQGFFRSLSTAFMPAKDKLIKDIVISFNDENISLDALSEGEKKLLLIKTILELVADEDSLVLLDEPDSHIHVSKKREISGLIKEYKKRTNVITTHSPKLTDSFDDNNVYLLEDGDITQDRSKHNIIQKLLGESLSLFEKDAIINEETPLLLVEGKGDVAYLKHTIALFKDEFPKLLDLHIFPTGGAESTKPFYDELKPTLNTKKQIVILFDRDEAGKKGMNSFGIKWDNSTIKKGIEDDNTHKVDDNTFCLMLPKPEGFNGNNFLIEDYFLELTRTRLIQESLTNITSFNGVPRDLKQNVKDKFSKELIKLSPAELANFKVLLTKINETITPQAAINIDNVFYLKSDRKGIDASATFNAVNDSMLLLKGSKISKECTKSYLKYEDNRKRIIKKHRVVLEDKSYVLTEDILFHKPSPATSFVYGSNRDGWKDWKNRDGKSIDELYRKVKVETKQTPLF
jgi:ABC-type multidrug transport system ATPase subunit